MATVAGNIPRASPSGACALGATIVLQRAAGTREVSVDDFFNEYQTEYLPKFRGAAA